MSGGLITGLAIAAFQFLLALTGPEHSDLVYNADLILLIAGIVVAHRALRAADDRRFSYLRALGAGALVSIIAGLISRAALFLQLRFYDDGLIHLVAEQWRQVFAERGMAPEEIEASMSQLVLTPMSLARGTFLTFVISGFLVTLLISAFTRRRGSGSEPAVP